jgi:hypothetical protein
MARTVTGYPPGYSDPEYDGTEAGFAAVVLPARAKALQEALNAAYADVLPEGVTFQWLPEDEPDGTVALLGLGQH